MQQLWIGDAAGARLVTLPPHNAEVLPGIPWGRSVVLNTPAYWAARCLWPQTVDEDFVSKTGSVFEEVGFCLLGGFGIRYEMNAAAFERLRSLGAFDPAFGCGEEMIRDALLEPLHVGGRWQRYRFPNQRAGRLTRMREGLADICLDDMPARDLREALTGLEGVGPKTASWIVRNLTGSDDVAIIDVHVLRACTSMRLFPQRISLPRDYFKLEAIFLRFAEAIGIRASVLDAVMWSEMRETRIN